MSIDRYKHTLHFSHNIQTFRIDARDIMNADPNQMSPFTSLERL